MSKRIEDTCRMLIEEHRFQECEKELKRYLADNPHSPIPHNLFGILMEIKNNHLLAMKHFRAAYALDPTYIPARMNMDGNELMTKDEFAYKEEDCIKNDDSPFKLVYDRHHVGHIVRK